MMKVKNKGIYNVSIKGISSAVPKNIVNFKSHHDQTINAERIIKSTGIESVYIANNNICASDLCYEAALQLIKELKWEKDSVDLLVFVTQTPDYKIPATSCILQARLGLSKNCAAFDINLGCSGYVYGLSVVYNLLSQGNMKRALLLVGDTSSKFVSPFDSSTYFLFGDAGTATALEHNLSDNPAYFSLHTNGEKYDSLMVKAGGSRFPSTNETTTYKKHPDGTLRTDSQVYMNSSDILAFTLQEIPPLYSNILELTGWSINDIDACVMHQANELILNSLRRRLDIPIEKMIIALKKFGNTSSASIPLAITDKLEKLKNAQMNLVLIGYGVGFSWGAASVTCGPICLPNLIEVIYEKD